MATSLFIVQGEGKGHMSQAMALKEHLEEAGHTVVGLFLGTRPKHDIPDYFTEGFADSLHTFESPWFLRTPNKKGIYIGRTLLFHLLRLPRYISEAHRIRREIDLLRPDVVFNFYDVVGALALRKTASGIRRIGIGHHFLLHFDNYRCDKGSLWHRWLLKRLTGLIILSCDRVLALSFRELPGSSVIEVVPPLVRRRFREMQYKPGDRYLAYFLNEGLLYDLVLLARKLPEFQVDLFTSLKPNMELPAGITLHPFDADKFSILMASCRGLITSAGFDAAAEAAYHGIPLVVIPTRNHFEQACNGADIMRSGIGVAVSKIEKGMFEDMNPAEPGRYRFWVDRAAELMLKVVEE
ncbi:MAG: hypothetical protein E4H10_04440 [Bacteroidia bacterium]|nr:MAG: hypothetical protein E4H10_04440 [Bacteroidia bacterium]